MKSRYVSFSLVPDVPTKILEGLILYLTYKVYKPCFYLGC
jgi:hypothetical protein